MVRATSVQILFELRDRFSLPTMMSYEGSLEKPRDVHWSRVDLARTGRQARMKALRDVDMVEMPFCSFYHSGVRWAEERRNRMARKEGVPFETQDVGSVENALERVLEVAPVDIEYQIEFWAGARKPDDALGRVEAWMLWRDLPEPLVLTHTSGAKLTLQVEPGDPTDNSDLEAMFEQGEYYRWTFPLLVKSYVAKPPGTFNTILSIDLNLFADLDGYETVARETI